MYIQSLPPNVARTGGTTPAPATTTTAEANPFGGLFDAVQGIGAAAGGLAYADLISDRGQQYANQMGTLAGQLQSDSAFKGYGVTTGVGSTTVGADGSLNLGAGPDQAMIDAANAGTLNAMNQLQSGAQGLGGYQGTALDASQQAMANSMMSTAGREQDIYNRAMAMQQPMLDQQRAQQQAREFAQGRGGIRGSQFGGTGEDAAMARAQAQAQNNAAFQSMGQAQQEMMNQGKLANMYGQGGINAAQAGAGMSQAAGAMGNQMYQMGYMPANFQLNALQAAQGGANMAQTGQLTGTGYGAQLGLGGIQTAVNADKAGSELTGNVIAAIMNNANSGEGEASWLGGLLGGMGII